MFAVYALNLNAFIGEIAGSAGVFRFTRAYTLVTL